MPTNIQNFKDKDSEEHLDIKSSAAQLREMLQQVKIFQNCNAKSERKKKYYLLPFGTFQILLTLIAVTSQMHPEP